MTTHILTFACGIILGGLIVRKNTNGANAIVAWFKAKWTKLTTKKV